MRLSTVFISSTFVLAGMSAAFPVEAEDMLVARFADSDFLSEVEARAYDEEPELYVHGDAVSTNNYKTLSRHRRSFYEPSPYELTRRHLPDDRPVENDQPRVSFAEGTKGPPRRFESLRPPTPTPIGNSHTSLFNSRPHIPGSSFFRSRFRNSRELPRSELTRRHNWDPHRPETPPPRGVTWSEDTDDTPDRPRRPPTPHSPSSPDGNGYGYGNGYGNGNENENGHHNYRHRPRSFFDFD